MERNTIIDVRQILQAEMGILHRLRDPNAPAEINENDAKLA
jgi:hypothetical protein